MSSPFYCCSEKKLNLLRALTHVLWVPPYDQISGGISTNATERFNHLPVILPPEGVPVPLSLGSSTSAVTTANKLWDIYHRLQVSWAPPNIPNPPTLEVDRLDDDESKLALCGYPRRPVLHSYAVLCSQPL
ncbi:hypothetical protein Pelo_18281 [Pelomyxa schiedti]|nr:hypothetical protein Pelo_18281 [Pelomyxa schiedti]